MKKATVIIVSRNQLENAKMCVQSVIENNPDAQVIVADNCSTDGTVEWLAEQTFDYVVFDEGAQEYGKIVNILFDNFAMAETIVFLNADYRVEKDTINNMLTCIEKDEKIGVVGCCIKSQNELFEDDEPEDDYQVIGNKGYCYAIPTEKICQIGALDARMADMEGAMHDYQLRALVEGYINKTCHNAYISCEKSTENNYVKALRACDRKVLRTKWGMHYFTLGVDAKFSKLIQREKYEKFAVLEIGCDTGANLLGIKRSFPNCELYGVELNQSAATIGGYVANVVCGNIEEENVPFEKKFDYIIFGDVLEHLHNPGRTLEYCKSLLNENGRILACIPNIMHISVMQQLLKGEFRYTEMGLLDKTHIHFFTAKEIIRMFTEIGYEMEGLNGVVYKLTDEEEHLKQKLMEISDGVTAEMYEVFQYMVVARMK